MAKPLVAIVGRTNVGKSALFNRLAGRRIAVVEDKPGVTRDRLYATTRVAKREIMLIDTGGLIGGEEDVLVNMVAEHARIALAEADLLVFVVDGQEGITSHDMEVADIVRRSGKAYVLVANKMEKGNLDSSPFLELRLGMPVDVSATHNVRIRELSEAIAEALPPDEHDERTLNEPNRISVAVVGRPNVGKSSLVNALLGEKRVIVSDIPGTTREAVDVPVTIDGQDYLLVDTAGLRRKSKSKEAIEFYSTLRSAKAIERAHVVLVLLDASEGVTQQDQRIAGMAEAAGKATAIIANKWDLIKGAGAIPGENPVPEDERTGRKFEKLLRRDFDHDIRRRLPFLDYAEIIYTSATEGSGIAEVLPLARKVAENYSRRVSTGALNRSLEKAVEKHAPPSHKGKRLRVYYATQVSTEPPAIVCFVNNPKLMHWSFERYLMNTFRKDFGFDGTPIRMFVRSRNKEENE